MPWVMGSRALRTDRRTRRIAALLAAVVAVTLLVTVSADPVSAGPTSDTDPERSRTRAMRPSRSFQIAPSRMKWWTLTAAATTIRLAVR